MLRGSRSIGSALKRLMRNVGIAAPGPPPHQICPYLLRNMTIERPNQVWAADLTYLPIGRGFSCLAAGAVLAWRISNTIEAQFYRFGGQDMTPPGWRPERRPRDLDGGSWHFSTERGYAAARFSESRGKFADQSLSSILSSGTRGPRCSLGHHASRCRFNIPSPGFGNGSALNP